MTAFEILQKHHDYIQKNGEKPSDYDEDRILAAMEEYAALRIHDVSGSLGFDKGYEQGYNDATKEACREIVKNYLPNDR